MLELVTLIKIVKSVLLRTVFLGFPPTLFGPGLKEGK